jgi:hypothetical protein
VNKADLIKTLFLGLKTNLPNTIKIKSITEPYAGGNNRSIIYNPKFNPIMFPKNKDKMKNQNCFAEPIFFPIKKKVTKTICSFYYDKNYLNLRSNNWTYKLLILKY